MASVTHDMCLPGTRVDILQNLVEWLVTPSHQNIFWLAGIAGSGKSTIAATVARHFCEIRHLGSYLCFDRKTNSEPSNVIRTLAYQLGSFDPRIGAAISNALSNNPTITISPLSEQFNELLLQPLGSVIENIHAQGPIVIILDALDECGNQDTRLALVKLLTMDFQKLPPFIRILITSRPELDILAFKSQANIHHYEISITTYTNSKDIVSYLHFQTAEIVCSNGYLFATSPDWPGDEKIQALSASSAGLFIWCSTAMRFIKTSQDPREKLEILLQPKNVDKAKPALSKLYELYHLALQGSGIWTDETFVNDFCAVMGVILLARQRLTHQLLDKFLGLERPSIHTIQRFGCLLQWGEDEPVQILHPSFADFLTNKEVCGDSLWYIDSAKTHHKLALRCFQVMWDGLHFNMCNLKTSYIPNDKVHDLATCIQSNISPALTYSCSFWADHLNGAGECEIVESHLKDFLQTQVLYWLEVLSLIHQVSEARSLLQAAVNYMKVMTKHFNYSWMLNLILRIMMNHSRHIFWMCKSLFLHSRYQLQKVFHIYTCPHSLSHQVSQNWAYNTFPIFQTHCLLQVGGNQSGLQF